MLHCTSHLDVSKQSGSETNQAISTGAVDKSSFIDSGLQELSVSLCRCTHRIVAAAAALLTRMTGRALIPGLPIPTDDAAAMDAM